MANLVLNILTIWANSDRELLALINFLFFWIIFFFSSFSFFFFSYFPLPVHGLSSGQRRSPTTGEEQDALAGHGEGL